MQEDPEFWHNQPRPLGSDILEYAAQDVVYLPEVFECMRKYFLLPYNDTHINQNTGESVIQTVTVYNKLMSDSNKC